MSPPAPPSAGPAAEILHLSADVGWLSGNFIRQFRMKRCNPYVQMFPIFCSPNFSTFAIISQRMSDAAKK
jgi:hypothetical protein